MIAISRDADWLKWRPYDDDPQHYVDPTGGLQNDPAYWRGAVASKYGLPLDYFEAEAAHNATKNAARKTAPAPEPKPSWLSRLFRWSP